MSMSDIALGVTRQDALNVETVRREKKTSYISKNASLQTVLSKLLKMC